MRTVFHIGTNKTGSSTIQLSLTNASDYLATKGVYYPKVTKWPHHTPMLFSICGPETYPTIFGRGKEGGIQASEERAERLWNEVEDVLDCGNYHTLVLSSEYTFGLPPEAMERLVAKIRTISDEVELVGYFRSPSSHYASGQQQTLKFGARMSNPLVAKRYHLMHRKIANLGCDKITVKPFDRKTYFRECIVQDFLKTCIGMSDEDIDPIEILNDNESVSAAALPVLQEFNQVHFGDARRPGNVLSKALLEAINAVEREQKYSKPRLKRKVREMIDAVNRSNMLTLREEAGIEFADFDYDGPIATEEEIAQSPLNSDQLFPRDVYQIDADQVKDLRARVLHYLLTNNKG